MSRRRSTPWIHRWSRVIIGAIAVLGALLTAYLTFVKLTGGAAACVAGAGGSASCNDVLSSPYATVFGLPLSVFGFLGYTSMAIFALVPLAVNSDDKKQLRNNLDSWTWLLLFAGALAMTVFSGYLMYLLAFKIKAFCLYCFASALFSLSLLTLTIIGRTWEDFGQVFFTAIVVGMVTLIGTLGVYASVDAPVATTSGPPITTTSGPSEQALAAHLKQLGAKMYGAYWCHHCHDQKQIFGKEAFSQIAYIECAPDGKNSQAELCTKAGIKSYPTWEIKGKLEPGVKSGQELAKLSGYEGAGNFKNSLDRLLK